MRAKSMLLGGTMVRGVATVMLVAIFRAGTTLHAQEIPADASIPDLVRILETDKLPERRIAAIRKLANWFREGASRNDAPIGIPALVRAMLNDDDTLVRRSACTSFRGIGPLANQAAPALVEIIKDKRDPFMQELACVSLGAIVDQGSKEIVLTLVDTYKKEDDKNEQIKGLLLIALGKIGHKEDIVVPLLIEGLGKTKPRYIRGGAVGGLRHLGPKAKVAVPALIEALDVSAYSDPGDASLFRSGVLEALCSIGPAAKAAVPAIRRIADEGGACRFEAEKALKAIERK